MASPESTGTPPASLAATPAGAAPAHGGSGDQHGLVRNTAYLTIAQAVTIPISVANNALAGRYLGPEALGALYVASTACSFAVLALEWGQQGAVPALVSRDRARAGIYLGTSLSWRATSSLAVSLVLVLVAHLLGYDTLTRWALALSFPMAVLGSFAAGFKDTIRGFERTDIPALAHVGQQFGNLLVLLPVLLLGGDLRAALLAQLCVALVTVLYLRGALGKVVVAKLQFDTQALKQMLGQGTPFFFFGLAMVLAPNIDASFLAKLVPAEVIGWYSVSQRLIGLLIFPATALIGALYPTLCRLHSEDRAEFAKVTRGALYGVALFAVPAALGCGLFPELGVAIFGTEKFGGAAQNLRVMAAFIFLVYFSMPLGTCVLASNKQRAWTLVQSICVVTSLVVNPLLIPYFQQRYGNGGLGPCVGILLAEVVVVSCGIALAPRGVFDRGLIKTLALLALSGGVMAGLAWLLKPFSSFLAAPVALLGYALCAWFSGAVQPTTIAMVKGFVGRKLGRAR